MATKSQPQPSASKLAIPGMYPRWFDELVFNKIPPQERRAGTDDWVYRFVPNWSAEHGTSADGQTLLIEAADGLDLEPLAKRLGLHYEMRGDTAIFRQRGV